MCFCTVFSASILGDQRGDCIAGSNGCFHGDITSFDRNFDAVRGIGTSDEGLKVSAIIGFISYLSLISIGWFGHMFPVKRAVATLHLLSVIAMIL